MTSVLAAIVLVVSFHVSKLILFKTCLGFEQPGINYFKVRLWLNLFVMIIPGTVLLLLLAPYHYLLSQVSGNKIFIMGSAMISYSLLSYSATLFLITRLKKIKYNYTIWQSHKIRIGRRHQQNLMLQIILISLLTLLVFVYIGYLPQVHYFDNKMLIYRSNISSLFDGWKFLIDLVQLGAVIVSFKSLIYLKLKPSIFSKGLFYYVTFITLILLTFKLEKGPLVYFVLGLFVVYNYLGIRVNRNLIILITGLLVSFLGYLYRDWFSILSALDKDILFSGLFGRVLIAPTMGFYLMLESFPKIYDFLFFSSYSSTLSGIFGLEHSERSARLIQYIYNTSQINDGTAGVINTYYLGEAWANFGLIGVVVAPILVASTSFFSFLLISGNRISLNNVAILAALTFGSLMFGGFNDYLYNLTFILYLSLRFIRSLVKT